MIVEKRDSTRTSHLAGLVVLQNYLNTDIFMQAVNHHNIEHAFQMQYAIVLHSKTQEIHKNIHHSRNFKNTQD